MYGCVELNCSNERYAFAYREIFGEGVDEMCGVDANGYEDVQRGNLGDGYRNQAAVRIVDEEIAAQRACRVVIYTARAICNISHYQR